MLCIIKIKLYPNFILAKSIFGPLCYFQFHITFFWLVKRRTFYGINSKITYIYYEHPHTKWAQNQGVVYQWYGFISQNQRHTDSEEEQAKASSKNLIEQLFTSVLSKTNLHLKPMAEMSFWPGTTIRTEQTGPTNKPEKTRPLILIKKFNSGKENRTTPHATI